MSFGRFVLFLMLAACVEPAPAKAIFNLPLKSNSVAAFDCPVIDDSNVQITPSSCNIADGSILNITGTGTGTLRFKWYDVNQKLVASTADLTNVPAGSYTLELSDDSKCITPVSKTYQVGQKMEVTVNEGQLKITPATCAGNDGSITGLVIENATQIQWQNIVTNAIYTTNDLTGVASGTYRLTATGANGCSHVENFNIGTTAHFPTIVKTDTVTGVCDQNAGSIIVTFNLQPTDPPYTYKVISHSNQLVGNGSVVYSPAAPTKITIPIAQADSLYTLVLADPHYCTMEVAEYKLPAPVFSITESPAFLIRDDACGRHTGAIVGLSLKGGTPFDLSCPSCSQKWTWKDSTGNVVAQTAFYLVDVGKGTYDVTVADIAGCVATAQFTVGDSTAEAIPPIIKDNPTLCLPGQTELTVINPVKGYKYRLYDSTQTNLITENEYGTFYVNVTHTTRYYITSALGLCESAYTPAIVTVVAPGVIIPNTFTPNNDGVNDYWNIPHISDFPGAEVSIYDRDGLLVYHSINYSRPFDGTYNGKPLPVGTYYYIVDLKSSECFGKVAGFLALIR